MRSDLSPRFQDHAEKLEAQLADVPPYEGDDRMHLTLLGTGTSGGVPILGCQCAVCRSRDPRDMRLRTSALLETRHARILIDCGPDARQQLLSQPFYPLDAVLITHSHFDHVAGIDDLRGFCVFGDQHIYAEESVCQTLHQTMPYCFQTHLYPGVPRLDLHAIRPHEPFRVGDVEVMPLRVMHGKLPILGFRVGGLAYITDMKSCDESELAYLRGVDTLVVNTLRWETPHHSHMIMDETLAFVEKVKPRVAWLVHVTHRIGLYDEAEARLPEHVHLAHDGLRIDI